MITSTAALSIFTWLTLLGSVFVQAPAPTGISSRSGLVDLPCAGGDADFLSDLDLGTAQPSR